MDILKQLRATFVTDVKYTNTVTFLDNTEHSVLARSMRAMQTTNVRNNNKNLRTDPNDPYALPTLYSLRGYPWRAASCRTM